MQRIALFYTKREIGFRLAVYSAFGTLAGAFGGLIAFGIQHAKTGISNWRLLFILEVFPSMAYSRSKVDTIRGDTDCDYGRRCPDIASGSTRAHVFLR